MIAPGTRLGPYEIDVKLGEGGMGVVYRARDTRLGRSVAIKVLPPAVAGDADLLRRFGLEARAASSLNHPGILTVFDVGTEDGSPYLVTELLEGATLRGVMRDGPVPLARALDWTAQVARGLAAAHEKGILHRDLKPENLFLTTDGRIKILDFGLAKLMPGAAMQAHGSTAPTEIRGTDVGALVGTMGFIAPEQIRGELADDRTDLFALGCVLFELVTGKPAFVRRTAGETLAATLTEEPSPLPSTPPWLAPFLRRCLAKRPGDRPSSALRLLEELEGSTTGASAVSRAAPRRDGALDSVAVLPFVNESDDPELEYLSEGIAESVLDALTRLPRLRVLARSTVIRFKARVEHPVEVGRELGVDAVVTGRIRQRGDRLLAACELVAVEDGSRLWGRRYERPFAELMAVRDEIADELKRRLRGKGSGAKRRSGPHPASATPATPAYQAYLRGRYSWNRWTPDSLRAAVRHYEEALAHDPEYALAWAGLADAWAALGQTKAMAPGDAFPRSKAAAYRALALDDQLAEAHASLGFVGRFWDWDWDASEASFRRAIALAPGYATAHRWFGHLCTGLGRHDEGIAWVTRALELDPLSLIILTAVGDAYFYARRYEEAVPFYRRALEMDPEFLAGHSDLARALEYCGRTEEALAEYERAIRVAGLSTPDPSAGLANALAVAGRRAEARAMLQELAGRRAERYVPPWSIASIHARLGEAPEAMTWLERAFDEHDSTLVWLKVHPRFDALRDEPRFRALVSRMGL